MQQPAPRSRGVAALAAPCGGTTRIDLVPLWLPARLRIESFAEFRDTEGRVNSDGSALNCSAVGPRAVELLGLPTSRVARRGCFRSVISSRTLGVVKAVAETQRTRLGWTALGTVKWWGARPRAGPPSRLPLAPGLLASQSLPTTGTPKTAWP